MKVSEACRKQIIEPSEGLRLRAYRDSVGVWTIGYGHSSSAGDPVVRPGMVISDVQADQILSRDLVLFEAGVSKLLLGVKNVEQREFDALVSLAFNIGLGNLRSSSLLRAYRAGDKMTSARKFMDWNRAGGRVLPGLTTRRAKERAWFMDGRLGARTTTLLDEGSMVEAHYLDHPDNFVSRAINSLRAPSVEDWP